MVSHSRSKQRSASKRSRSSKRRVSRRSKTAIRRSTAHKAWRKYSKRISARRRAYDKEYSRPKKYILDARSKRGYLYLKDPSKYDFLGVDTGVKRRWSRKQRSWQRSSSKKRVRTSHK